MGVAEAAIAAGGQLEALPSVTMSTISVSLSSSKICVPTGTFSVTLAPLAPVRLRPMPCVPVAALKCCW